MTKQRNRRRTRNFVQAAHLSRRSQGAGKHRDRRQQAQRKWATQQLTQPNLLKEST